MQKAHSFCFFSTFAPWVVLYSQQDCSHFEKNNVLDFTVVGLCLFHSIVNIQVDITQLNYLKVGQIKISDISSFSFKPTNEVKHMRKIAYYEKHKLLNQQPSFCFLHCRKRGLLFIHSIMFVGVFLESIAQPTGVPELMVVGRALVGINCGTSMLS